MLIIEFDTIRFWQSSTEIKMIAKFKLRRKNHTNKQCSDMFVKLIFGRGSPIAQSYTCLLVAHSLFVIALFKVSKALNTYRGVDNAFKFSVLFNTNQAIRFGVKSKMLFHAFLFFFTSHIANNKWLKQPKQRAINGQNSEFPIPSAEWNFSGPKSEKNAPNIT